MSYPGHIRTLIIEDEQVPVDNYTALFKDLREKFDLAPPIFARSRDDAIAQLARNVIFHLVIIDLGLPQAPHETAAPGVEPGFEIVRCCARRDNYPIPCVLVISGRLGQTKLPNFHDSLKRDFWHGELVNKGTDEEDAILLALQKIGEYCRVGVHLRDGGDKLYPTLSPREHDLLRRCVLAEPSIVGVDLEWWSADQAPSTRGATQSSPTKVLCGQFLLNERNDPSRPCFFKFESTKDANSSRHALGLMVQKLSHIKRCYVTEGINRSLIVTQQVGEASAHPISLADLMAKPHQEIASSLPTIASDIAAQLANLGSVIEESLPVSKLLWDWHDPAKIREAYLRHGGDINSDPTVLLEKLRSAATPVWVYRRNCTHGDLNATNIALELSGDTFRAFIFDAAGMGADSAGRDLAMLEVTLLLHRNPGHDAGFSEVCKALYADVTGVPELPNEAESWSPAIRNIFHFICEIRKRALQCNELRVYALLIFDCAMLQLGGLAVQSRGNKIVNPSDSVLLADLTARWLTEVAPDFLQAAT